MGGGETGRIEEGVDERTENVIDFMLKAPLQDDDDDPDYEDEEEEEEDSDETDNDYANEYDEFGGDGDGDGDEDGKFDEGRKDEDEIEGLEGEDEVVDEGGENEDRNEGQEEKQQRKENSTKDEDGGRATSSVVTQSPLEDFGALFEDISRVVGEAASTLKSNSTSREAAMTPNDVEISKSLSLLEDVSSRLFCEIPFILRAQLTSALHVLVQATALPSPHASAIHIFSNQFETMCQSYDANSAISNKARQFFDSKESTLASLRRLNESNWRIRSSIDGIRKEKELLQKRLRELEHSESQLLKEYNVVGTEAQEVKAEWDGLIVKNADMVEQGEKAEKEKARIETMWTGFISHLKD